MKQVLRISFLLFSFCFTGLIVAGWENVSAPAPAQKGDATVLSASAAIYREFTAAHPVIKDSQSSEVETVNRVSSQLIKAVTDYYTEKKNGKELEGFQWEIHLFRQKKEDAWCLPGGKMAVYDALIKLTQNDGSLAVVLAHEIAHVLLKHGDARMKKILKEFLGGKNLAAALSARPAETKDFFRMAYGNGDYVGVIRGFSAADEREADELGAIFCGLAGYKPEEALVFWERMMHLRGTGRQPELLSTHPVDDERIPQLRKIIDDITRVYYKHAIKN